jgi:beta-glucosidase/6-phospho-beta-glucosidase/beta-galactosidase
VTSRPFVLATLEGYSVEGGYDRPGEPTTCFSPTIALGRHSGPGEADGLWTDYERVLDATTTLGIDGVRFGLEWARIEPHQDELDEHVLSRYREVFRYASSLGLRVSVAVFGATWPAWLGLEAWLLPWVAPCALRHARRVVEAVGADVDGLVLFADPEALVRAGYLEGSAPPWRRRANADAQSVSEQIAAVSDELRRDAVVGPLVVARTRTFDVDAITLEEARRTDVDEVYVRALVKGKGPTSAPDGLLVKHDGQWRPAPGHEVRQVLG